MITIVEPTSEMINQLMDQLSNDPGFLSLGEIGIEDFGAELGFEYWQVCAVVNGVPVGIVTVSDGNEIYKLYVSPDYRNKHIAKNLVDYAIESICKNNHASVHVAIIGSSGVFWTKYADGIGTLRYVRTNTTLDIFFD